MYSLTIIVQVNHLCTHKPSRLCHLLKDLPCLHENKKCSKVFAKEFVESTQESDGYPLYQRKYNVKTFKIKGV